MNAGARPWPLLFSQGLIAKDFRCDSGQCQCPRSCGLSQKFDGRALRQAARLSVLVPSGSGNNKTNSQGGGEGVCFLFNKRYCGAIHFESLEDFQPVISYMTCKVTGHIDWILHAWEYRTPGC